MALRVLVVGAGSIGRRHHENMLALGAKSTLRGWRDYGQAGLEADLPEFDAVVVATSTDIRMPVIERAAEAGLPMYIEKPLTFTPSLVEAIDAITAPLAERSMLGLMMRYHPAVRDLSERDLSDVFQAQFSIGHDVTQWRANWKFSQSYAARPEGGGVLLDLCHELDLAHALFPELSVKNVVCQGHDLYPGVDMASQIALEGAGMNATVSMDYLTPRLHRRAILRGTEAEYDFNFAASQYVIRGPEGEITLDKPLERNQMFMDISRDFLSLVEGKPTSDNRLQPRLDWAMGSARLTAKAWAARQFIGNITKAIP